MALNTTRFLKRSENLTCKALQPETVLKVLDALRL
jgi:hypothetical protein